MDALALLLADSRFPSGGYAHSHGLEQAVADGLTVDEVPAFAAARLRLVGAADARVAVAARRAQDTDTLVALDEEWCARCPSPELREAARRLGSQLLRSAAIVWDDPVIAAYREASSATPRPVALGVVAAVAGLDDEAVALLALYDDAATVTSAALKLLPLDPAIAARWLAELAPAMTAAAFEAAADRRPVAEQPPPAAIAIELAAPVHKQRRERLFAS
jgi:urease accessory protein